MNPIQSQSPHILIDFLSSGIGNLLDDLSKSGTQTIVWKPKPFLHDMGAGNQKNNFKTAALDWEALLGEPNDTSQLECLIKKANEHFNSSSKTPVNVAVYGTHGQVLTYLRSKMPSISADTNDQSDTILFPLASNRKLLAKLFEILSDTGMLNPVWLKSIYPGETNPNVPSKDLIELADTVRAEIALSAGKKEILNSVPFIYQRTFVSGNVDEAPGSTWRRWSPDGASTAPRSVTKLIEKFDASKKIRGTKYVLVKLLLEDTTRHNPLDTPILRPFIVENLTRIGINAILWDKNVGIIAPDKKGGPIPKEVFSL